MLRRYVHPKREWIALFGLFFFSISYYRSSFGTFQKPLQRSNAPETMLHSNQLQGSGSISFRGISDDLGEDDTPAERVISNTNIRLLTESSTVAQGTVLILTPLKNAARNLDAYFRMINGISYPKKKTSLGFLVGDSTDGTFELLNQKVQELGDTYRSLTIIQKDYNMKSPKNRHSREFQMQRRKILALSRNYLVFRALQDEDWTIWLDVDVKSIPSDIVEQLQSSGKDIVAANAWMNTENRPYDLNNWQETEESLAKQEDMADEQLLLEGYRNLDTHRLHMDDLMSQGSVVRLHGVGGAALLVRADRFREGLLFPPFVFRHQIETEGLSKLGDAMGVESYGMPNLKIEHN